MMLLRRVERLEGRVRQARPSPILVFQRPDQTEEDAVRDSGVDPSTTTLLLIVAWNSSS